MAPENVCTRPTNFACNCGGGGRGSQLLSAAHVESPVLISVGIDPEAAAGLETAEAPSDPNF